MVPLLPVLTNKYLDLNFADDLACHRLGKFLAQAYEAMECNDSAFFLKACKKMAQQCAELKKRWGQLGKERSTGFHSMPKLHLFDMKHPPKDTWIYKDETCGGTASKLFTKRSGKDNHTMLLKSRTDGLAAIVFLFGDFLAKEGISKKKLRVLGACQTKATTRNHMQKPEN